jgi:hypothetical protein
LIFAQNGQLIAVATAPTTALALGNGPLPFSDPLLFVIPSEAEGSAVPRTSPGNVFYRAQRRGEIAVHLWLD